MRIRDFILAGVAAVSIAGAGAPASAQDYTVSPYFDNPAACWDYGWYGIYSYPYCGWYDGFFYPGSGFFVYDRGGHRHHWDQSQQNYWASRRPEAGGNTHFPGSGGGVRPPQPMASVRPGSSGGAQITRPTGTVTVRPGSSGGIQLSQPVFNPGPRNNGFNGAGGGAFGGIRGSGVGRVSGGFGGGGNHGGFGGGGFGGGGFHGSFGGFGGGGFGGGGFHGGGGGRR